MPGPKTDVTFKGPCHCCSGSDVDTIWVVAIPDRAIAYVNGIIGGYPGNCPYAPDILAEVPGYPNESDYRSALRNAYAAAMAFDFDRPPVPWGDPLEMGYLLTGHGTFPHVRSLNNRRLFGTFFQESSLTPPLDGLVSNPNGHDPKYWDNGIISGAGTSGLPIQVFFATEPPEDVTQPIGLLAGLEINSVRPDSGFNRFGFGICDFDGFTTGHLAQVATGPFASATRIRVRNRDHVCISSRRIHFDEESTFIGGCSSVVVPSGGLIIDPYDPDGPELEFTLTGIADPNFESIPDVWQEGRCLWLDQPCADCACVP